MAIFLIYQSFERHMVFNEIDDQPRKYVGGVEANNLDEVFAKTQNVNGHWNKEKPCRSVSVSDVIVDEEGKAHMVMMVGFKELDKDKLTHKLVING